MQLTGYQKIHIISVGFEVDRAYLPVVKIGGDKVYLIRHNKDTEDSDSAFRKNINEVERLLFQNEEPVTGTLIPKRSVGAISAPLLVAGKAGSHGFICQ